jgi:hypothetical protein
MKQMMIVTTICTPIPKAWEMFSWCNMNGLYEKQHHIAIVDVKKGTMATTENHGIGNDMMHPNARTALARQMNMARASGSTKKDSFLLNSCCAIRANNPRKKPANLRLHVESAVQQGILFLVR